MSTREKILLTACQVIKKQGIANLTLDFVAKEVGISKGGLLYHFPSKEKLIFGIIQYLNGHFSQEVEKKLQANHSAPGSYIRAYMESSIKSKETNKQIIIGLLAAVANDIAYLKPLQEAYVAWQEKMTQDGIDPITATIIRLVIDGLWVADLFDLSPPQGERRTEIINKLITLIERETK